jgi:dihydroneopterin aldolase
MAQLEILLEGLSFYSFHGLYPEEKRLGGQFIVDAKFQFTVPSAVITHIEQTPDYSAIYELIKQSMHRPTELLETLVMQICEDIHVQFPLIEEAEIAIKKVHPPIVGFTGSVAVSYKKRFK